MESKFNTNNRNGDKTSMNKLSRRDMLFIFLGFVLVIYSGYLVVQKVRSSRDNNLPTTSFSSPLTKSSDRLLINYGGSADGNTDSNVPQYRFFALSSVPLTSAAQQYTESVLPKYLALYIQPPFGTTYIHIVKDSVEQTSDTVFSFRFYIDSPETYFQFKTSDDGNQKGQNPITPLPWQGVQ